MKLLLLAGVLLFPSCKSKPDTAEPERTETARIYKSNLAADGCDERIQLLSDRQFYRPTTETLPLLDKAVANFPADSMSVVMNVRFTLTGSQTTLQCGRGASSDVGEMRVIAIQK